MHGVHFWCAESCTNVATYSNTYRCTESYSYDAEDKGSYAPGWIAFENISMLSHTASFSNLDKAFIYTSAADQDNYAYWGEYAIYSGGGYTANLGNSLNSSQTILADLMNSGWIDMYTRAVFVEFNVFNPGSGLATDALVLLEMPTTGDNRWSWRMDIVQLYRYSGL